MLFNSFSFAVFLPVVFAVYWIIPNKYRWILLLISSYYFYMSWNVKYVLLILFTTGVSYFAAILLEKHNSKKEKNFIVTVTAVLCLGVLFVFKYFNFASESINSLFRMFSINLQPITLKLFLPVGISFYTFQTLSYVIDVYRGTVTAEHNFGYYATFISFFPQLVAGPIERTSNLLPQIKKHHVFDYTQATYGLKLMAWGYFKKIIIADVISEYVSLVYDCPQNYHGFALVLASLFFTVQIYCDFSGYSDIAIGVAKLLGINLMTNFKSPYFSQSIKEFWSRWHISLSVWFRDYVYIPLGGNRVKKFRNCINLLITFLASGLWHGADWTFVAWGGVHGIAQIIEKLIFTKKNQKVSGAKKWIKIICVFIFCVFSWVLFVSNSISDAGYVLMHLFDGIGNPVNYLLIGLSDIDIGSKNLLKVLFSVTLLAVFDYFSLKKDVISYISSKKKVVRWIIYFGFLAWIFFNFPAEKSTEFIYFQF